MASEDDQTEIEGEFVASWDDAERFFKFLITIKSWELLTPILALIAELRKRGYDRQLRAGHSHWHLILFRSQKHYVRRGQHSIQINAVEGEGMGITYFQPPNPKIEINQGEIKITAELEDLLKRLLAQPIN